jgi:hypothetical protein
MFVVVALVVTPLAHDQQVRRTVVAPVPVALVGVPVKTA